MGRFADLLLPREIPDDEAEPPAPAKGKLKLVHGKKSKSA